MLYLYHIHVHFINIYYVRYYNFQQIQLQICIIYYSLFDLIKFHIILYSINLVIFQSVILTRAYFGLGFKLFPLLLKTHKMDSNNYCWEKSIKGKSINRLPIHAERARYGVCRKKCFISYMRILHVNSLVSIDTSV